MKTFLKNFMKCGILGWCLEIIFTALFSARRRDMKLKGTTSLFMFPIYGLAAFLAPLFRLLKSGSVLLRGFIYACLIFTVEFFSGTFLAKHNLCPWDYHKSKWNINGVIRLDYLPFWAITGLLFERLLCPAASSSSTPNKARRRKYR